MCCGHSPLHPPFRHWMRHMAAVPKGYLRHYVLRLLSEKPMSGSEIMNKIEEQTRRSWKPSPGSVYPLLAWLQDKGYTKEVPEQEQGIKRYTLTNKGKEFLKEHETRKKELRKRIGFFTPPFLRYYCFNHYPKNAHELIEAGEKLVQSSGTLFDSLREKYSKEVAEKAKVILKQATKKLDEITKELKE